MTNKQQPAACHDMFMSHIWMRWVHACIDSTGMDSVDVFQGTLQAPEPLPLVALELALAPRWARLAVLAPAVAEGWQLAANPQCLRRCHDGFQSCLCILCSYVEGKKLCLKKNGHLFSASLAVCGLLSKLTCFL